MSVTEDRPPGRLHLGYTVGTTRRRMAFQQRSESFFGVVDLLGRPTRPSQDDILQIADLPRGIVLDPLAIGIDP